MFFIPCGNWKTLFLQKLVVTLRFFQPPYVAFFETGVLKEVRLLRILPPQCSANTKVPK